MSGITWPRKTSTWFAIQNSACRNQQLCNRKAGERERDTRKERERGLTRYSKLIKLYTECAGGVYVEIEGGTQ